MSVIFICSPYGGLEENYFRAQNYCRYVVEKNHIPLCPATMFHGVYDENIPAERGAFQNASKKLLELSDEIWVFGKNSTSTLGEISQSGKKVVCIQDTFRFNTTSETISFLVKEFEVQTGKPVNHCIMENMLHYLNQGLTDKLIIAAIKIAAKVGAGWNYVEAVLNRCLNNGITTAEELARNKPQKKEDACAATYDVAAFEKMLNAKD